MVRSKKVLILSYYWPPSGGSGVQRWMYFAKYLKQLGWEPIIITVDEKEASYPILDKSLLEEVNDIRVIKTRTREPLKMYSRLSSGRSRQGIPQGEVQTDSLFKKIAAYIRGNFFIPDARKGWVPFATEAAKGLIKEHTIEHLITTGPPHSTHLVGLALKKAYPLNWWADFRDPWTTLFYNKQLYRSTRAIKKDAHLEKRVLQSASGILTTIGGALHENLAKKAPQQEFIALSNGYDAYLIDAIKEDKDPSFFHIVYTGLLTRNQAYPAFIQAIKNLVDKKPIRFSLAGNIPSSIIKEIKDIVPDVDVHYSGYVSHHDSIKLMKSADLLVNFIFDGAQTEMISGKLLEYFATQVPVLSLGNPNSIAGKFVAKGSCAEMISPKNSKAIRTFVEMLYKATDLPKNKCSDLPLWSREALTQRLIAEVLDRK